MFNSLEELFSGKWSISTDLNYSIEALRFLNEILQWNRDYRPFPDQLVSHPYFSADLESLVSVKQLVPTLKKLALPCLMNRELMFNIKDSSDFEDLYRSFTGR